MGKWHMAEALLRALYRIILKEGFEHDAHHAIEACSQMRAGDINPVHIVFLGDLALRCFLTFKEELFPGRPQ